MKTKIFTMILILAVFSIFATESYACSPLPPVAVLTAEPEYVGVDETVILDGSDSYDPDEYGSIVKYEWDFTSDGTYDYNETSTDYGDGAFDGRTTHEYDEPNIYTVTLRVTDNNNPNSNTDTDTCTVYVTKYYVSPNGDDDANGLSWATAFKTIQRGIDAADLYCAIEVNEGTYYEAVDFNGTPCIVRSTDPTNWEVVTNTIIDANATRGAPNSVVSFCSGEGSDSVITGFTITNGYGRLDPNYGYYAGGGVFCGNSSSPTISNCIITGNMNDKVNSDVDGGGIACYGGSDAQITNCIIRDNNSYYAGAASFWDSNPAIKNCIIGDNVAYDSGGLYCTNSDANIINCTIVRNTCTWSGGGLTDWNDADPNVRNCIFWDNNSAVSGADQIYNWWLTDCDPIISYCDIKDCGGGGGWDSNLGTDGGGNIDSDPCFVDPDSNDFHLRPDSPCIDVGDSNGNYEGQLDIDYEPRVLDGDNDGNSTVDMGGDEFDVTTWSEPNVVYVDVDATGDNDGSCWADAYTDIGSAISAAAANDEIWVAEGTYTLASQLDVNQAVSIYGGFDATETSRSQRDWRTNETIVDGNDSVRCFYITADSTIDGVTITDGYVTSSSNHKWGGGIKHEGGSLIVANCTFTNNSVYVSGVSHVASGGALASVADDSSLTVTSCIFAGNKVYGPDQDTVEPRGGAITTRYIGPIIKNCLFYNNIADGPSQQPGWLSYGGAIFLAWLEYAEQDAEITNCTFYNNSADSGAGIRVAAVSSPMADTVITNCILWDESGNEIKLYGAGTATVTYSNVQDDAWDDGTGCINAAPDFVNAANDNYRLIPGSVCVDTGNPDTNSNDVGTTDLDGDNRFVDGPDENATAEVDMGCYEYNPATWSEPNLIYVDVTASGDDDGTSWANAFDTIEEAISTGFASQEIWVADGTYTLTSTIDVDCNVSIYGGFDGDETSRGQRDWRTNKTIVDGNDSVRCFYITANSTIDGVTITNGYVTSSSGHKWGGGIKHDGGSLTVANCTFTNNSVYVSGVSHTPSGGALASVADDSSLTVTNCVFAGNKTYCPDNGYDDPRGGAITTRYIGPIIKNCLFYNNIADGPSQTEWFSSGGAIFLAWLEFAEQDAEITNCTFYNNSADYGAGIRVSTDNSPTADAVITNCILWDEFDNEINLNGAATATVTYSNVQDDAWDDGTGCINAAPEFVDSNDPNGADDKYMTSDDGLRLDSDANSPCIDAADGNYDPNTDILGNSRYDDPNTTNTGTGDPNYVDMGAYEKQSS